MKNKIKRVVATSMSLVVLAFGAIPALADTHRTDLYLTTSGGKLASYADSSMGTLWDALKVFNEIKINGVIDGAGNSKECNFANYCSTNVINTTNNYNSNNTYYSSSTHQWKYNGADWHTTTDTDYNI
ncbi:MAG: hypothetical protein K0R28_2963 [Paenibacillus sp.]|jgi:hypothetical protein|nr:hypothetical protein [Paenibacillus sp.]